MAATTFILFPRYAQPTVSEARALESCIYVTGTPRYGINKKSGGLAIEFDAAMFKTARLGSFEFDALVSAWEKQGCTVSDTCPFAPNEQALQPKPDPPSKQFPTRDQLAPLEPQALRAREAVAMSRLETAQVAANLKAGGELVKGFVPYLALCFVLCVMLYVGYAAYRATENIDVDSRRQTLERISNQQVKGKPASRKPTDEKRDHYSATAPSDANKNSPSPR